MEIQTANAHARADAGANPVIPQRTLMEDKPALHEVFAAEESPLLRYAFGLVGQRETAEDLVQDAFLKLHAHWNEVGHPRAWLYRSVHNLAINHLRDHRKESRGELPPDVAGDALHPDQSLGRMEAVGTLQLLVSELDAEDRHLIHLKYRENLKYEQISQKTGLSVGNVGYKLHHLLRNLSESLRRMGIESPEG